MEAIAIISPKTSAENLIISSTYKSFRSTDIGRWQGDQARYVGSRKNLFDLRRVAVIHNLHVLAKIFTHTTEPASPSLLRMIIIIVVGDFIPWKSFSACL